MSHPLHLLTLPREVRNLIYDFLFQETQSKDFAIHWKSAVFLRLAISIENSPLPNVLLVHPQIRAEYLESTPFRELRATIFSSTGLTETSPEMYRIPERDQDLATTILGRTKHLTLYHFDYLRLARFFPVPELLNLLAPDLRSLHSLCIATRKEVVAELYITTMPLDLSPFFPLQTLVPAPTFLDLPLVQKGSCLAFRYSRPIMEGEYNIIDHIQYQVYTAGRASGLLWDEDAVREWKSWPYPESGLPDISVLERERLEHDVNRFRAMMFGGAGGVGEVQ